MLIETTRFGSLEVDDQRLITFPQGMLGFPDLHTYALVQTGENSGFYWLQSTECTDLAFVVCDPRMFLAEYRVQIRPADLEEIGLADLDRSQTFIVVNKVDGMLTGNLQGPIVVNVDNREAKQVVLNDRRYSTRHPLMLIRKAAEPGAVSKTA